MSYYIFDIQLFYAVISASTYTRAEATELITRLRRVDYSVVESRREGHAALNTFIDSGTAMENFVGEKVRFPAPPVRVYSDYDAELNRLITSLSNSLSWRSSSTAKDETPAPTPGKPDNKPGHSQTQNTQETQDNTKRFEELTNSLAVFFRHPDSTWMQTTFETKTKATWTATGKPPLRPDSKTGFNTYPDIYDYELQLKFKRDHDQETEESFENVENDD